MEDLALQLIARLTTLPKTDPRLEKFKRLLDETEPEDEALLSLTKVAKNLGYHPTWLDKLRVPEACGRKIAGRNRYSRKEVLDYLESDACQRVLAERRQERREKTKNQTARKDEEKP